MSEDLPETQSVRKKPETVRPFKGEIVDYPGAGRVVVVTGYHRSERDWGQIIREQFQRNITDKGEKVVFFDVQDSPVDTGVESPTVDAQIAQFLRKVGNVEMVIDVHEHPGALTTVVRNSWSLTAENEQVAEEAKSKVNGLRILTFDDYSRRKTGGENVPYAITDPDLPKGGVDAYSRGEVTPQIQEAVNDTLSFIVNLSNIQLEPSSAKE